MSFFVENNMVTGRSGNKEGPSSREAYGENLLSINANSVGAQNQQNFASQLFKAKPNKKIPTLPQQHSSEEYEERKFNLALKRSIYNYTNTYFDGIAVSANLPQGEEYDAIFKAKVFEVALHITDNFKNVVYRLVKESLASNLPDTEAVNKVQDSYQKLREEFNIFNLKNGIGHLDAFMSSMGEMMSSMESLGKLPRDIEKIVFGMQKLFNGFYEQGASAILKSSMHELLNRDNSGRDFRHATKIADYEALFDTLKKPMMLSFERQPWMTGKDRPCDQDWFFGELQTAGFNTSTLRGVVLQRADAASQAILLDDLLNKCGINDAILQKVLGQKEVTLEQACRENRLYACDYAAFNDAWAEKVFGEQRYLVAPIALFYWNSTAPAGYPPLNAQRSGVLQPIAIQLGQQYHAVNTPLFTPNNCAGENDPNGLKWRLAKFLVNTTCAMHHESIAHLGDCHLVIEPMVLATHRQLSTEHPIFKLLYPHFRFTININYDARNVLIAPGGVVATNVGPAIESTYELISKGFKAWQWDENAPDKIFTARGVDKLPQFAYRDDTLLLWQAISDWVKNYLSLYYKSDADVINDHELQAWINELLSPRHALLQGLNGLKASGNPKQPYLLDSLDYLIRIVSHIIHIAGPQHTSVNNAQYELMSYMPSVAGAIYHPAPGKHTLIEKEDDLIKWIPPLDVGLFTFSFEYLLAEVQYDRFGHYGFNPKESYFSDPRVHELELDFIDALALIEIEIRKRNKSRALPYPHQLPSLMPNSVCI